MAQPPQRGWKRVGQGGCFICSYLICIAEAARSGRRNFLWPNSGLCYPPYAGTLILPYAGYAQSALYWLCSCYTMLVLHTSILGF